MTHYNIEPKTPCDIVDLARIVSRSSPVIAVEHIFHGTLCDTDHNGIFGTQVFFSSFFFNGVSPWKLPLCLSQVANIMRIHTRHLQIGDENAKREHCNLDGVAVVAAVRHFASTTILISLPSPRTTFIPFARYYIGTKTFSNFAIFPILAILWKHIAQVKLVFNHWRKWHCV